MALTFNGLSLDVKVMILERIPAKDIQRFRQVSSDMRSLVDTYSSRLSTTIHAREVQKLSNFIATNIDCDDEPPFIMQLARWLRATAVRGEPFESTLLLEGFVNYFGKRKNLSFYEVKWVRYLVFWLEQLARHSHGTSGLSIIPPCQCPTKKGILDDLFEIPAVTPYFTEEEVVQIYDEVIRRPPNDLAFTLRSAYQTLRKPWRHYIDLACVFTHYRAWPEIPIRIEAASCEGGVIWRDAHLKIAEILRLPELPETDVFSYRLTLGSSLRLPVLDLFKNHLNISPVPLVEAAIIEEIRIF